jgi:hypothetical protein
LGSPHNPPCPVPHPHFQIRHCYTLSMNQLNKSYIQSVYLKYCTRYGFPQGLCKDIALELQSVLGGKVVAGYLVFPGHKRSHWWLELDDGEIADPMSVFERPFSWKLSTVVPCHFICFWCIISIDWFCSKLLIQLKRTRIMSNYTIREFPVEQGGGWEILDAEGFAVLDSSDVYEIRDMLDTVNELNELMLVLKKALSALKQD